MKHFVTDGDIPRAVMLLRGMLPDFEEVQYVNRPVVKQGSRTVRVDHFVRDPVDGTHAGYVGFGYRVLFWRPSK